MKRMYIPTVFTLMVLLGACSQKLVPDEMEFSSADVWLTSRGQRVPATWVKPKTNQAVPLVLLIHGHGGTRHEAGGFTRVAEGLLGKVSRLFVWTFQAAATVKKRLVRTT